MAKVTYVPLDKHDPSSVVWNGIRFDANVPVELDPKRHTIDSLIREEKILDDGRVVTKMVPGKLSMVESARGNPSFQVEGEAQAARKPGRPRTPKTPEEYRSFAHAWFATVETHEELAERWEKEGELRDSIGFGEDDLAHINPFFEARYHELQKMAA